MQSERRLQTEKLLSFKWLTVLRLSCSLHANPMCPYLRCDFEHRKILKFREGCVHTSILMICNCFSNCCFGILMSRSFSFKRSTWQDNPGSQCQKTACRKEASGKYVTPSYLSDAEARYCVDELGLWADVRRSDNLPSLSCCFLHSASLPSLSLW